LERVAVEVGGRRNFETLLQVEDYPVDRIDDAGLHLERTLDALFGRVDAQVEVIVGHVERGLFRTERPTRIERVVATRARRKHEPQQQRQSRYFPAKTVDAHVGDVMPGRWKYSGTPEIGRAHV